MIARTARQFPLIIALVFVLALVPAAFAAKGAGGGGGGGKKPPSGGSGGTGTLSGPVLLNSTDGLAHYGQNITFNVTSTAQYYFVRATCFQNGTQVWQTTEGFYPGWLWGTTYTLAGLVWTGGAANCTAVLYDQAVDGSNQHTEASMSFNVYA